MEIQRWNLSKECFSCTNVPFVHIDFVCFSTQPALTRSFCFVNLLKNEIDPILLWGGSHANLTLTPLLVIACMFWEFWNAFTLLIPFIHVNDNFILNVIRFGQSLSLCFSQNFNIRERTQTLVDWKWCHRTETNEHKIVFSISNWIDLNDEHVKHNNRKRSTTIWIEFGIKEHLFVNRLLNMTRFSPQVIQRHRNVLKWAWHLLCEIFLFEKWTMNESGMRFMIQSKVE